MCAAALVLSVMLLGPGGFASASDEEEAPIEGEEDIPMHEFRATIVTIGKASGKEKKKEVDAFVLKTDDAAAAAFRFCVLNDLPESHVNHFVGVFKKEIDGRAPPAQHRLLRLAPTYN